MELRASALNDQPPGRAEIAQKLLETGAQSSKIVVQIARKGANENSVPTALRIAIRIALAEPAHIVPPFLIVSRRPEILGRVVSVHNADSDAIIALSGKRKAFFDGHSR